MVEFGVREDRTAFWPLLAVDHQRFVAQLTKASEIMPASVEDLRQAVLGDMRQAHEIAGLAGCGTDEIHYNLAGWKAEGRLFSVKHEGAEYSPVYALDPG